MAYEYDDPIGTGQTYTTISAWESARNSGSFTGDGRRGRCLGENFNEAVDFDGGSPTATAYLTLTANPGDEHDGRANDVSGAGNARIVYTGESRVLQPKDDYIELSWLEVQTSANSQDGCIRPSNGIDAGRVHHMILHANGNTVEYGGVQLDQNYGWLIYRNIAYGFTNGDRGINFGNSQGVPNYVLYNTSCRNSYGFDGNGKSGTNENANNVYFDNGDNIDVDTDWSNTNNATEDTDGDPVGLQSLTPNDNIKNSTTTWASFDGRLKDSSADIYHYSSDNAYSPSWTGSYTTTFPEIDVPISDRNTTLDTGTNWTIGADDEQSASRKPDLMPFMPEV